MVSKISHRIMSSFGIGKNKVDSMSIGELYAIYMAYLKSPLFIKDNELFSTNLSGYADAKNTDTDFNYRYCVFTHIILRMLSFCDYNNNNRVECMFLNNLPKVVNKVLITWNITVSNKKIGKHPENKISYLINYRSLEIYRNTLQNILLSQYIRLFPITVKTLLFHSCSEDIITMICERYFTVRNYVQSIYHDLLYYYIDSRNYIKTFTSLMNLMPELFNKEISHFLNASEKQGWKSCTQSIMQFLILGNNKPFFDKHYLVLILMIIEKKWLNEFKQITFRHISLYNKYHYLIKSHCAYHHWDRGLQFTQIIDLKNKIIHQISSNCMEFLISKKTYVSE